MVTAAATEHNANVVVPVVQRTLATATTLRRQQHILNVPITFSSPFTVSSAFGSSSTSSSSSSCPTSKLTKAAMARRFLLRGRKKSTANVAISSQDVAVEHGSQQSQRFNSDSVDSPNSVIVSSGISGGSTSNRKSMKEKSSAATSTTSTKGTPVDVVTAATCVLCYDDMDRIDADIHPIVCMNSGCTFNCCSTCTETILEHQQNADAADADMDGMVSKQHQYAKVKCPNCRSDLSRTIFDTSLLRLVDRGIKDDIKTLDSNQQLKVTLCSDHGLQYEIEMARQREVQFIEEHQKRSDILLPHIVSSNSSSSTFQNLHIFENDNLDSWYDYDRIKLIDTTLLCGLENVMTWYEQETVTRYYTSCNTNQLGMAAKLLYHTRTKLQQQQQQQQQQQDHLVLTAQHVGDLCHESNAVATTIYQLIEAGKRARYRTRAMNNPPVQQQYNRQLSTGSTESPSPTTIHRKMPDYYTKLSTQKATQFRKIEHEVRQQTAYIKRYPLPIRLPKYCECCIVIDCNSSDNGNVSASQIVKCLPFRFCNDQWDGTIMDAYTKFIIQRCTTTYDPKKLLRGKNYSGKNLNRPVATSTFVDNYKVHQRRPYDDVNIRNILNMEQCDSATENRDVGDNNHLSTVDTRDDNLMEASPPSESNGYHSNSSSNKSRVMIASVVNMAVASMIFPGDVVTHINGIELHDYTVDDIIALICSLFDSEAATTTLTQETQNDVVNAIPASSPPPPPPTSSPITQTLSMLDETINLFTSTSSTSMDTDRSHFFAPPSPKPSTEQATPDRSSNKNNSSKQKVLQLQFVFNADIAVAKALQLRATAIRWQQQ